MARLKSFAYFWYDFIVGDDWLIAAGVVAALVITWAAAGVGLAGWLWLPLLVTIVLATSLWRATTKHPG